MEKPADPATLRFPPAGHHPINAPAVAALDVARGAQTDVLRCPTLHAVDGVADIGGGFAQEGVVADQSMLLAAGIFAAS